MMQIDPNSATPGERAEPGAQNPPKRLARQLEAGTFSHAAVRRKANAASEDTGSRRREQAQAMSVVNLAQVLYGPMLTFNADKVIGEFLRSSGTFQESNILDVCQFLAQRHGFKAASFVDIGANIGTHLVFALKEAGFHNAFGVEPDASNYRLLVCNVLLNELEGCTSLSNLALSDEDGFADLELSAENFGDHRIRCANPEVKISFGENDRKSYQVPKVHAGRWLASALRDSNNALIWIDTQGHEGHVFRCFLSGSLHAAPRYVVAEFWPYGLERAGGKDSYFQYLAECDAVYDINAEDWSQLPPLEVASLADRYDRMLAETTAVHYPHTDLLCIRDATA